jgi:hypothetical protein
MNATYTPPLCATFNQRKLTSCEMLCLMGNFGEEFITYETGCSRGHHLKFIFAKKVLKAKLDKGKVTFFCYDCDRVWLASSEQKIELRNLAMS